MSAIKTETMLIVGGVAVIGLLLAKALPSAVKGAGGLITGNNAITQNATDANGNPVTAYQGAGIFGTLGAGANAALGGAPASGGSSFGSWLFDLFDTKDYTSVPSTAASLDKWSQGGNATTGSGSIDLFQDPAAFGWNWGG
jgi:hypothetical protein